MAVTCPNIGPAQRRRRLRSGIVGAVTAIASGFILAAASAPTLLRALVLIPLALAAFGFLQYRAKT